MKNPLVSYFPGNIRNTTKQYKISIAKLHQGIVSFEVWKIKTDRARAMFHKHGKRAPGQPYEKAKANLDYFMPSGVWNNRKQGEMKLLKASYMLQIDVDNIELENMEQVRQQLINDKHTVLLYKSPSGRGFKGLIKYNSNQKPLPVQVVSYYQSLNIEIDKAALPGNQACYLCHDAEAYLNLDAEPFIFTEEEKTTDTGGGFISVSSPVASDSTARHVQAFCSKVIDAESSALAMAGAGQGCYTLNQCAYKLARYANAGLAESAARAALWQAFSGRQFSKHDKTEFNRVFSRGWSAGKDNPKIIPDRPITD
jgi:hypothetical protein